MKNRFEAAIKETMRKELGLRLADQCETMTKLIQSGLYDDYKNTHVDIVNNEIYSEDDHFENIKKELSNISDDFENSDDDNESFRNMQFELAQDLVHELNQRAQQLEDEKEVNWPKEHLGYEYMCQSIQDWDHGTNKYDEDKFIGYIENHRDEHDTFLDAFAAYMSIENNVSVEQIKDEYSIR